MPLAYDFLGAIGVDRETVDKIRNILEQNRDMLHGSRPHELSESAFGGSPAGLDLGAQTATAHQHVVEAIEEMMAGLQGYATNVVKFADDITGTDEDVQALLLRGTRSAERYASSDNFHDNGIAPPATPEGGTDGGEG